MVVVIVAVDEKVNLAFLNASDRLFDIVRQWH